MSKQEEIARLKSCIYGMDKTDQAKDKQIIKLKALLRRACKVITANSSFHKTFVAEIQKAIKEGE